MKIKKAMRVYICMTVFAIYSPLALLSQAGNADVTGVITDPTSAVITGAQITAQNTETGLAETAETNSAGIYRLPSLPPGAYRITVQHAGFKSQVESISLTVGQSASLNIQLQVGSNTQTVTVNAQEYLLNTTTAEISNVVSSTDVRALPLNGRDPASLILLSPGTVNLASVGGASYVWVGSNSFSNEEGVSANGGQQGSTFALLDGVQNMDTYMGVTAPFPNPDATQEFRTVTSNFGSEYGGSPNAIILVTTKSGTNEFHGGAFEFLRNGDFNASNWFSGVVDTLKRNQFGGFLGGPILKNKLFIFGNYQGTYEATTAGTVVAFTPTAAMLSGDFSAVPFTLNAPFATVNGKPNQVSPSLLSSAAVQIAKTALPLGQDPATGQVTFSGGSDHDAYNEGTGRLDYLISPTMRMFARSYILNYNNAGETVPGNILAATTESQLPAHGRYYNEVIGSTWLPTPSIANVIRAAWIGYWYNSGGPVYTNTGQQFCFSKYIDVTEPNCYMERFSVNNGFNTTYSEPNGNGETTWWLSDDLTKSAGPRNVLTAGFNLQHQKDNVTTDYPVNPLINFDGSVTGMGLADYLLGDMSSFSQGAFENSPVAGWQIAAYAQDQWKGKDNLTITAGLRWDPDIAEKYLVPAGNFIAGEQSQVYPNAPTGLVVPGDPGVNDALRPSGYNYIEPRLGVAWAPGEGKTVYRAGFGIYRAIIMNSIFNEAVGVPPFSPFYTLNAVSGAPLSFQNPWASFSTTGGVTPFPTAQSFIQNANIPASQAVFLTPISIWDSFSPQYRMPQTQNWTASIERQLTRTMALHVAYVGSESFHQTVAVDLNPGIYADGGARTRFPDFSTIFQNVSWGTASYNSLQVRLLQQSWHGLMAQESLTWSKVLDLQASSNLSFFSEGLPNPFNIPFNHGIALMNIPFNSVLAFVYQAPLLQGHNDLLRQTVGGWEVSGITTFMSGFPFGIAGGDGNNNSESQQYQDRGDVVPGQPWDVHQGSKSRWLAHYFNPQAFTVNPPGTFGDTGDNFLEGPGMDTTDMAIIKNWQLKETSQLEFRAEAFNAFNHPNFGLPDNDPSTSNVGQITNIGPIPPRVLQLALKLTF